jgi:Domain of unknown function (DUF3943)
MRTMPFGAPTLLVLACYLGSTTPAAAQHAADSTRMPQPGFWNAAVGVLVLNGVPWAYNWYVQRWPWAKVGLSTWKENFRAGFVWDDDCFLDNQLAHPYHGSLYLNSARASGYGFWGSLPYVAAGSASWELLLENVRPSLNDFVNTTLGGMAIGEVTYRLSSLLASNRGARPNGFAREVGAFALSPITQTQALLHRGPDENGMIGLPRDDQAWIAVGRRAQRAFLILTYQYGSPFSEHFSKPYDAFEFAMELGQEPPAVIRRVGISGLLARRDLQRSATSQLVLGLYQHYDYQDLPGIKAAGQSLSGALLYQRKIGSDIQLRLGTHLEAVLLGAMSSDHGHLWRRDYDYGSGAGGRLSASFRHEGRDLLRFDARFVWLHSLYGAQANHTATYLRLGTGIRLGQVIGVGGDVGISIRRSWYDGLPPVNRQVRETRAYLMWPPD